MKSSSSWKAKTVRRVQAKGNDAGISVTLIPDRLPFLTARPSGQTGNPKRSWQASSNVEVKVLTEADYRDYKLADVVIPLPGYDITYPEGALFERYQAIMKEDGLDPLKMRRNQKCVSPPPFFFHPPGSSRSIADI